MTEEFSDQEANIQNMSSVEPDEDGDVVHDLNKQPMSTDLRTSIPEMQTIRHSYDRAMIHQE